MLARALYKEGAILVLDEPTAALDPLAENDSAVKSYHSQFFPRPDGYVQVMERVFFCLRIAETYMFQAQFQPAVLRGFQRLSFLEGKNGVSYACLIGMALEGGLSASQFLLYFTAAGEFTGWIQGILGGFSTLHRQSISLPGC